MFSSFPTFGFLVEDWQSGMKVVDVSEELPTKDTTENGNSVHIFVPERASELPNVQQNFPGGMVSFFDGQFADPLFYSYLLEQ